MTARAEFENLLGRASWGYDEADPDLIASCFTEQARMALRIGDRTEGTIVGPFEGRDAIRALHADSMAAQSDRAATTSPTCGSRRRVPTRRRWCRT